THGRRDHARAGGGHRWTLRCEEHQGRRYADHGQLALGRPARPFSLSGLKTPSVQVASTAATMAGAVRARVRRPSSLTSDESPPESARPRARRGGRPARRSRRTTTEGRAMASPRRRPCVLPANHPGRRETVRDGAPEPTVYPRFTSVSLGIDAHGLLAGREG